MDSSIDKAVAQKLRSQYITALLIVAVLTILGQLLIQLALSNASDNNHVINIAGRQRMLSQKLTKLALQKSGTNLWSPELQNEFQDAYEIWQKNHVGLSQNTLGVSKKYEVNNSRLINDFWQNIAPHYELLSSQVKAFIEDDTASQSLPDLLQAESSFLNEMDKVVFQYDQDATKKINLIRITEFIILCLTLITILIEFSLIFNPLAKYVERVIRKLRISEEKLKSTNNTLSVSNHLLFNMKNDLEKVTKERYEILRREDNIRSAAILEGQEEERRRLSCEIHDGLGQMLTGIKLTTQRLNPSSEDVKSIAIKKELNNAISETIEGVRSISFNLLPSTLQDFGIVSAIKTLVIQLEKNESLSFQLDLEDFNIPLDKSLEITIYRIVQEALNNVLKHSNAKVVKIQLAKERDKIQLSITDNGIGFDKNKIFDTKTSIIHNGLINMKTRTDLANGSFKLTTVKGSGTDIFINLPYRTKAQNE